MVRQRDRRNFKFQNVVATPLLQITAAKSQIILLSLFFRFGKICLCFLRSRQGPSFNLIFIRS